MQTKLTFITLVLLISFASVNAVLYTPALPAIAQYFAITDTTTQMTMTLFLIGYTTGQLIYGPLANRFGRKPALYIGISLQIISSLLCALAGTLHTFSLLAIGRFFLALGAGVGLKMTFTLVNEYYPPQQANQKIAYLMMSFALAPGLVTALGSLVIKYYGWMSSFYLSAFYGAIILLLTTQLVETKKQIDIVALKFNYLVPNYLQQFKNRLLFTGALFMGIVTSFIYLFAAISPFIAINLYGITTAQYGFSNLLPPLGLLAGTLLTAQLTKKYSFKTLILIGIVFTFLGAFMMLTTVLLNYSSTIAIFLPMTLINFGLALILPTISTIAMMHTEDKSNASAVMNFINMGVATLVVLTIGFFNISKILLPSIYLMAAFIVIIIFSRINYLIKIKEKAST